MKIGLDFDDVICEFMNHFLIFYHKKTGKKLSREDFKTYNFWQHGVGTTREEAIKIVDEFHNSEIFDEILPVEKVIDSINNLIDKNKLFIITSRPNSFKEKTNKWIEKHLGDVPIKVIYSGDFHTDQGKTKAEICKELGIKLMIEDAEKYALECAGKGIKVILFDKPWNQGITDKNIIRVNNWLEALKEINKIVMENN